MEVSTSTPDRITFHQSDYLRNDINFDLCC